MGSSNMKPAVSREVSACFSRLEEDITCSVCLQQLLDPVSIACGHSFCRDCITKYWSDPQLLGSRCPECRKLCPKEQLIPVYRLQNMVAKVQLAIREEQAKPAPIPTMQLAYTDGGGRLQLDESVVQRCFLDGEMAELPLCLICVIGEKRRGKSTLLNYILRALQRRERGEPVTLGLMDEPLTGFEWKRGVDSVTKGIWIWSKPFILEKNGEKMAVYVLDTEGSLDIEGDRESSIKLSALSMLLSSHLIFNVGNSLKSTELDYLEMYLHVAEVTGVSLSLHYLQHMSLLVRDWQDPDHCGKEAAGAYLAGETEKLRRSSEYHRVLETLRSPCVSGFLLPYPGKAFLRNNQGRLEDMDGDFRGHLTTYISDLVARVWQYPKTDLRGEKITCAHVGRALRDFVPLLREASYTFSSPMEMFYSLENKKNMKTIVTSLQDFLEQQLPSGASPVKVLGVKPSQMRSRVTERASQLLGEYQIAMIGDNNAEKTLLLEEIQTLLAEKQEAFCSEYSRRFSRTAVGVGCAVGGVLLGLAGGVVGAAVAGTILAVEAVGILGSTTAALVTGTVGGSVTLGAVGSGIGAGVGGIIGHVEKKKDSKSEGNAEDSSEDTQHLVAKQD